MAALISTLWCMVVGGSMLAGFALLGGLMGGDEKIIGWAIMLGCGSVVLGTLGLGLMGQM